MEYPFGRLISFGSFTFPADRSPGTGHDFGVKSNFVSVPGSPYPISRTGMGRPPFTKPNLLFQLYFVADEGSTTPFLDAQTKYGEWCAFINTVDSGTGAWNGVNALVVEDADGSTTHTCTAQFEGNKLTRGPGNWMYVEVTATFVQLGPWS